MTSFSSPIRTRPVHDLVIRASGLVVLALVLASCGQPADQAASAATGDAADLGARVEALLDSLDAETGFYAQHLPSGREIAIRADRPMNTMSVIKIAALARAFQLAAGGQLDLDARRTIRADEVRGGSGLLRTFQPGLSPTYRDIITQMIITSDNTATDLVLAVIGLDDINHMLDSLGYEKTRFRLSVGDVFSALFRMRDSVQAQAKADSADVEQRLRELAFDFEGDSTKWLGVSTPRETARLLIQIHSGELTSPEYSEQMLGILRRQFYTSRLPRRVGLEVQVAHKTGDWPPAGANDVGLIFYEGGPLVVAVYVNQNRGDFLRVEETIGLIAEHLIRGWRE